MGNDSRSLRDAWEFRYRIAAVLEAANGKLAHHQGRMQWWEGELNKADAELKARGFEYRENRTSIGSDLVIVGDPELAKRVRDCRDKISEHRSWTRNYETWVRALAGRAEIDPKAELSLRIDDIVFFGL